jgi:hypothetical protein
MFGASLTLPGKRRLADGAPVEVTQRNVHQADEPVKTSGMTSPKAPEWCLS